MEEAVYEYKYITDEETVVYQSSVEAEMAQFLDQIEINESAILRISETDKYDRISIDEDNVKYWLKQYKRHHPMLQNPNPELQQRLRKVRVLADGKELTAKEMWETFYRNQIDELMSGGTANYVAALSLMIPCMERVYTLRFPEFDKDEEAFSGKTSYGQQMLEMFFPAFGFHKDIYKYLHEYLRNGVIHYAFIRGAIGINNTITDVRDYGDESNVFRQVKTMDGRILLLIVVPWFWQRVKTRIDRFYEHEQWLPGWDMSPMVRLDPYSKPNRTPT